MDKEWEERVRFITGGEEEKEEDGPPPNFDVTVHQDIYSRQQVFLASYSCAKCGDETFAEIRRSDVEIVERGPQAIVEELVAKVRGARVCEKCAGK